MAGGVETGHVMSYVYKALPGDSVIRIAEIHAGEYGSPLVVTLSETELHVTKEPRQAYPKYQTLSYEWGQDKGDRPIRCDDATVLITKNLEAALQRLRLTEGPLRIWIDSLCIDQQNLKERSHQVGLMPLIYKSATRVNMWLGEEKETTLEGLLMLDKLEELYHDLKAKLKKKGDPIHWLDGEISSTHALRNILGNDTKFDLDNKEQWNSVKDIISRTYFERTWITQELLLSWNATVVLGAHRFPWQKLRNAVLAAHKCKCLSVDRTSLSSFRLSLMATAEKWRWKGAKFTIANMLQAFHMSRCRDPRDTVFGIQGIAQYPHGAISSNIPLDIGMPQPDYAKPVEQVYQETNAAVIEQGQDLRVFQNIQIPRMRNLSSMPTWVIDWSPSPEGWWNTYQVAGASTTVNPDAHVAFKKNQFTRPVEYGDVPLFPPSAALPIFISGRVLKAQGLSLGKITWISNVLRQEGLVSSISRVNSAFSDRYTNILFDEYVNGESIIHTVAKTILMGRSDYEAVARGFETTGPGGWTPMFESFMGVLVMHRMFESGNKPEGVPEHLFTMVCLQQTGAGLYLAAVREMDNERLFVTDTVDLMGIGALDVEVGDTVVMLKGAYAPLVLRKVPPSRVPNDDDDEDEWMIVCEAYVHAAMHQEERIYDEGLCGHWQQYNIR